MTAVLEKLMFKKIEFWVLALTVFVLIVGAIVFAYIVQGVIRGYGSMGTIGDIAVEIAESPRYPMQVIRQLFGRDENLTELPEELRSTINSFGGEGRELGLISFFERNKQGSGTLILRDIETGREIERWQNLSRAPEAISFFDETVIVGGEVGIQDSWDSLSKVDKTGKVLWQTPVSAHHLIDVDSNGNIYSPVIMPRHPLVSKLLKGRPEYRDDGYAILSPDGKIIQSRSITQILIDNQLGYLVFGVGALEWDKVHLNAVKPAEQSSHYWQKGDLLLSLRHLSMVMLYRPSSNKVIWYQLGPWSNQHDPDFISDSKISVFGNDVTSSFFDRIAETSSFIDGGNNLYSYDFASQMTTKDYTEIMGSLRYATVTAGRHTIFRDGSVFIWFENQGIGVFFDKIHQQKRFFGCVENDALNRESRAVDAYPWEAYQHE
jgi:hypothetical protein